MEVSKQTSYWRKEDMKTSYYWSEIRWHWGSIRSPTKLCAT